MEQMSLEIQDSQQVKSNSVGYKSGTEEFYQEIPQITAASGQMRTWITTFGFQVLI